VIVELRSVPDCPNLEPVRAAVCACLAELGRPADVIERVGEFSSPSVLVDGVDVLHGGGDGPAACRLDLPTAEDIRAALRKIIR
jgi:hypothetical protein